MKNWIVIFGIGLLGFCISGCKIYSFDGTSIPVGSKTFYVEQFDVRTSSAIPTLGQTISQALFDKIRNESNLNPVDTDPDIEFKGSVTEFRVTAESPERGETTAFNRLNMTIAVEYINHQNEEDGWKTKFPYFSDFPSDQNLIDVQDQLIEEINLQLVDDVFRKAFTNW